ncbi:MAG: dihydrofolate reductase [Bacteroidia bacterium]|jgi:dihydrofolate reductase
MLISVIPVVLGEGLPLFTNKTNETPLNLVSSEAFENGIVNLIYKVKEGSS